VVSADLFYDAEERVADWIAAGALAVEMEAATVFTVAARHGVEAGCALLVSNMVGGASLEPDVLHAAELELGRLALSSLS
jgi:uridine phosphorylase